METEFFKSLGIAVLVVAFAGGFGYWILFSFKKFVPNFRYWFKYNVLKKKYNEDEVKKLLDYDQAGLSVDQVNRFLLVKGDFDDKKAKELCWIYRQIKQKGGIKK